MEPKTKLQKKVVELSSRLRPITDLQKKWAFDRCLNRYAAILKYTLYCLECGQSWKDKSVLKSSIMCTCPNCGSVLKLNNDYRRVIVENVYFGVLDTLEDMQVVRMFFVTKLAKKKRMAICSIDEVMQHWIDENGKITTLSKSVRGLTPCYDAWISNSFLEIRTESYNAKLRADLAPYKTYPKRKILPFIKRNGFNGRFYDFAPQHLFSIILRDSFAETLLKSKQIEVLKYYYTRSESVKKYWPSLKICIRNGYEIKNPTDWFDYLRLLENFGKDIKNSKFVCPLDLKKAHDRFVLKKKEQDKKLRLIELRNKIATAQVEFEKQKSKFFDIQFGDGEILITPLKTVEEFMIEGDELGHCLFSNEYYKKENSLILSARIDNKPIETIELSLNTLTVLQSRGILNKATKYHNRILNLVEKNIIPLVAKIAS